MAHATVAERLHTVQFYEETTVLAEQVGTALDKSLNGGGAGVAIARPLTLAMIELHLTQAGHDVTRLHAERRLALVDADALLPKLLVNGAPDREAFRHHIG